MYVPQNPADTLYKEEFIELSVGSGVLFCSVEVKGPGTNGIIDILVGHYNHSEKSKDNVRRNLLVAVLISHILKGIQVHSYQTSSYALCMSETMKVKRGKQPSH